MYKIQNLAQIQSNFFAFCMKVAFHFGDRQSPRRIRFTLRFVNVFVEVSRVCSAPICRCWFLFKTRSTKWFNFRVNNYSSSEKNKTKNILLFIHLQFQNHYFPSISYYFHMPKNFLIFFPHTGKIGIDKKVICYHNISN